MDIKNKHLLPRMLVAAIGLIFCGIGVGLSLYADLGVDPASVMETGVARVTGLSFGTATALINLAILLVVLFSHFHPPSDCFFAHSFSHLCYYGS